MILQLILIVLLVGVAEARELDEYVWIDHSNGMIATCNENLTKCWTACELKMKEAMKLAEKYKDKLFGQMYWKTTAYAGVYSGARCITVACPQKELDEAIAAEREAAELKQAKLRWDAIYQECVK